MTLWPMGVGWPSVGDGVAAESRMEILMRHGVLDAAEPDVVAYLWRCVSFHPDSKAWTSKQIADIKSERSTSEEAGEMTRGYLTGA